MSALSPGALKVLLVEDNPADAELILLQLRRAGFVPEATRVETEQEYLARLEPPPDIILSDFEMPQFDGERALSLLKDRDLNIPFVIISGTIGEDAAVQVMKHGAADYLLKDRLTRLGSAVTHAMEQARLQRERREAEAELAKSEARYRFLVEHAADGIFVIAPDGRYCEVNPRALELLGYSKDEFLSHGLGQLSARESQVRLETEIARLRRGEPRIFEWRLLRKDGVLLDVEISARMLPDGQILVSFRDLTERKRAEAAVEERLNVEARLSRLAATAPGAIYAYRIREDGSSYFAYASPQFEDLLGLRPEDVVKDAEPAFGIVHADDRAALQASLEEATRKLLLWTQVFRIHHPAKGVVWIEGRATPTREPDGTTLWHGFLVDVTERKQLEEQLRQAQKMEAIGQLAGGVAHDFNNLLTVILGHASLLTLPDLAGADIEAHAGEIEQAAERAASLTRQLLLFSRKQIMQPVDLDLNEVVGNMTKMLQRILGEDIVLTTEFAPGLPLVNADAGMVEQILLNLAVNSRDAMPLGGRLVITTRVESQGERSSRLDPGAVEGPCVCLTVADTGEGIPAEVMPRIFEPFYTTKEVGKGTGLGLATVYGIVKQHHGWLDVESQTGQGTKFRIGLPATPPKAASRPVEKAQGALPGGTETILVVEDEPALRTLVTQMLRRFGYRVLAAPSGVAALGVWSEHKTEIELLLTDMVMPDGMTGRQLAERLQGEKPELGVIFTSGYSADAVDRGSAMIDGVNFLQKPYEARKLAVTVRSFLDRM